MKFRLSFSVETALNAPLHPMDCTDIVVGSIIDGRLQINDINDIQENRSTPLDDTWFVRSFK